MNLHSWFTPSSDAVGGLFLDTLDDEFLIQHVTFSTRFQDGQIPSTLDLIITRDDVQLHNLTADAPLGRSDHVIICFDYVCSMSIPISCNREYLYEEGDYNQFNRELIDLDWNAMFNGLTTEEMWHHSHSIYCKLVDKYIPSVIPKAKNSPQWMSKSLKNIINLKRNTWAKY